MPSIAKQLERVRNVGVGSAALYMLQRLRTRSLSVHRPYLLSSRHAHYGLLCRPGTSDIDVFRQIFVEREYRCLDAVSDARLIIDCGANVGYSTAYFLSRFPSARVVAIEPDPENFDLLMRNIAPYGTRAMGLRAGVWSKKAGLVMANEPWGDNREWARTVREARSDETAELMAVDIPQVLEDCGMDRISILKVDIEGAERELFGKNFASWIDKADNIVIELHGDECADIFMRAIGKNDFDLSTCDELTVCRRKHL